MLELRSVGVVTSKAPAHLRTMAQELVDAGLLRSRKWLNARELGEFQGEVAEWAAYIEAGQRAAPGEVILRGVRFLGSLYSDATCTTLRVGSAGKLQNRVDVVPELDLLSVTEVGGEFEYSALGNVKSFHSGGAGKAGHQNVLALAALRAHANNNVAFEVKVGKGETAWAKITEVRATHPTYGLLSLTGKLREATGGARTETIGPNGRKSSYDYKLSLSEKDIDLLTTILREQQTLQ